MTNKQFGLEGSKILIVDDKQENLELLTQILEAEGYEVAFAMNGEQAIQIASLYLPDLILLDVMMPGIDGFETCRRIKALHDLKEIPVIFVTGKANISDVVKAFNIGAVDYVTKPIRHEEIIARVATHIQLQSLILLRDNLITQLRDQNITLEKMAKLKDQQLEKSEQFSHLGELVGELTHEVSTPLGIINTAITSLEQNKTDLQKALDNQTMTKSSLVNFLDTSTESFDIVLSNLRHAIHLVNSFRQIIVGEFSQARSSFDLHVYLEDIQHILIPKLKRSPHKLVVEYTEHILMHCESGALSQVLLNIINNALLHAFPQGAEGRITIKTSEIDDKVTIVIADNGIGVSEEKQSKMFEKYYTTKQGKGGSGLGLYIVKKLVTENLGGEISLQSSEGQGTCYTLILPKGLDLKDESEGA